MNTYRPEVDAVPTNKPAQPLLSLWSAVILRAYLDAWSDNEQRRDHAIEWIKQDNGMFVKLCDFFDVDPEKARNRLLTVRPPADGRRERQPTQENAGGIIELGYSNVDLKTARVGADIRQR